jgi:nucleoside 2-deoxyribosyltransferase
VAGAVLERLTAAQIAKASGWIRENQDSLITGERLDEVLRLRMPSVGEKAEKMLMHLALKFAKPGAIINYGQFVEELHGVAWIEDNEEFNYIFHDYILLEKGFLAQNRFGGGHWISPKGWAHIDSLRRGNPQSKIGFIAMSFDKSLNKARDHLIGGIRGAGYDPLRIDNKEHNNKIDDEIIAAIRGSKFLVADLTGHRGGVYFEAGFAMGLGLPVVWSCRDDEMEKRHFDTHQYNFIVWTEDKLADLSKALQYRIEATIGRGPLRAGNP